MKVLVVVFAVAVAVAYANQCVNNDPTSCSVMCPTGEAKACEHGTCTCSTSCTQASDCSTCPSHTDPMGHVHHEEGHCFDGACVCMPHRPNGGP